MRRRSSGSARRPPSNRANRYAVAYPCAGHGSAIWRATHKRSGELPRRATRALPRPGARPAPAIAEQRGEGDTAILEFHCPQALGALPGWPHRVELTLQIRLADELELSLSSRNVGTEAVTISQALHSYFAVSDIHQVRVEGRPAALHRYAAGLAAAPAAGRRPGVQRRNRPHLLAAPDNVEARRPGMETQHPADHPRLAISGAVEP